MSAVSFDLSEVASDEFVAPRFARRYWRAVARVVLDFIRERWPVDSAYSLSRWVASSDGRHVLNDADYVSYVHESPKNGGPPGLAERLWRRVKAGELAGQIDALVRRFKGDTTGQGSALEIFQRDLGARGPSLADVSGVRSPVTRLAPATQPSTLSAGAAVFDPIAATQGALAAAAPASLPAYIAAAPTLVGLAQRTVLLDMLARLAPSAPRAVIRALERGNVREAAELLARAGRADVAQALVRGAR